MNQPLTVQLAEAFGSKPVRKPLLDLIDDLIDTNLEGLQADGIEDQIAAAQRAERIHEEIARRIDELEARPVDPLEQKLMLAFGQEAARIDREARG